MSALVQEESRKVSLEDEQRFYTNQVASYDHQIANLRQVKKRLREQSFPYFSVTSVLGYSTVGSLLPFAMYGALKRLGAFKHHDASTVRYFFGASIYNSAVFCVALLLGNPHNSVDYQYNRSRGQIVDYYNFQKKHRIKKEPEAESQISDSTDESYSFTRKANIFYLFATSGEAEGLLEPENRPNPIGEMVVSLSASLFSMNTSFSAAFISAISVYLYSKYNERERYFRTRKSVRFFPLLFTNCFFYMFPALTTYHLVVPPVQDKVRSYIKLELELEDKTQAKEEALQSIKKLNENKQEA